ncbi:SLC13 family permease [Klebsiella pneumoniae]|uniref:SLC13 family permease n=1 Tax=Klebsiella pneumoniae TaxID=573 RepID=UPI003F86ACF2
MEPITITLCLLVFAIIMFVWEKVPLAVTSMVVCVALVLTGVLDLKQAFAGFIDSNVILFVAMFIVGGALFETGMANKVGGVITHFAKTEKQLIFIIMVVVGVMSGFLSNTGTAAVLIPVVIGVAAKSGFTRSRLLMPLVFAAALGGTLALAKALEMTGAGKLVADQVIGLLGNNSSPFMLLVVVFALSVVMTNFMSNTATVALLVPVSLSIAAGMGADPRAVLMATVIGSSCAYATPIGMPANMMVLSAGGYKFVDYAKSGIPLIIVSTIVSLILLPILFPFHP